jgi:hypothetical protein
VHAPERDASGLMGRRALLACAHIAEKSARKPVRRHGRGTHSPS